MARDLTSLDPIWGSHFALHTQGKRPGRAAESPKGGLKSFKGGPEQLPGPFLLDL